MWTISVLLLKLRDLRLCGGRDLWRGAEGITALKGRKENGPIPLRDGIGPILNRVLA